MRKLCLCAGISMSFRGDILFGSAVSRNILCTAKIASKCFLVTFCFITLLLFRIQGNADHHKHMFPSKKPFTAENWSVYGRVRWYVTFKTNKPVDNLATAEMITNLSKRQSVQSAVADGHRPSRGIVRKGQRIMQSGHAQRGRALQLSAPASRKQMKREVQTGEWQPGEWDLNLVPESSHTGDQPGLRISHGDRQTGGSRKQIANHLFAQGVFFLMWNCHERTFPDIWNIMLR